MWSCIRRESGSGELLSQKGIIGERLEDQLFKPLIRCSEIGQLAMCDLPIGIVNNHLDVMAGEANQKRNIRLARRTISKANGVAWLKSATGLDSNSFGQLIGWIHAGVKIRICCGIDKDRNQFVCEFGADHFRATNLHRLHRESRWQPIPGIA